MDNINFTKNNKRKKPNSFFVPNLSLLVILCMIIGYILLYIFPNIYFKLTLSPVDIIYNHEYWRLISWVITVPYFLGGILSYIFLPICLYFYYRIGLTLEYVWGKRNFNLFILGGVFFIDLFVMITAVILHFASPMMLMADSMYSLYRTPNWYIMLSMYLAIAYVNPDMKILLYFVIPVKIKYMAIVDIIFLLYSFIISGPIDKVVIFSATFNFLLFFVIHLKVTSNVNPGQLKRRHDFRRRMNKANIRKMYGNENIIPVSQGQMPDPKKTPGGTIRPTKHICAVCGRTELDDPELEFRYCSKCNGTYEYCSDHLFTHQHVQ